MAHQNGQVTKGGLPNSHVFCHRGHLVREWITLGAYERSGAEGNLLGMDPLQFTIGRPSVQAVSGSAFESAWAYRAKSDPVFSSICSNRR